MNRGGYLWVIDFKWYLFICIFFVFILNILYVNVIIHKKNSNKNK